MKNKFFEYKKECRFIGFQNCDRDEEHDWKGWLGKDEGFEKALAFLDREGGLTISEAVFHVRCNAGKNIDELIPATLLKTHKTKETEPVPESFNPVPTLCLVNIIRDMWDGMREYLIGTYECPICKATGENEIEYLGVERAKSDMQIYGYRGANRGC